MINEQKKELRKLVKLRKEDQSPGDYYLHSSEIMHSVEKLTAFNEAETVMLYWSIPGEVFTHDFIIKWAGRKQIILPSVDGDRMNLKIFESSQAMLPGDLYLIPEPDGPLFTKYENIDLIIVPGIAFDRKNNRLGRGKAYYDRFLHEIKAAKIGICFLFQLFDIIPADENDIKMDMVITNTLRKR